MCACYEKSVMTFFYIKVMNLTEWKLSNSFVKCCVLFFTLTKVCVQCHVKNNGTHSRYDVC